MSKDKIYYGGWSRQRKGHQVSERHIKKEDMSMIMEEDRSEAVKKRRCSRESPG